VRELEHVIESAILECAGNTIEASHLEFDAGFVVPAAREGDLEVSFRAARQRALARFEHLYVTAQLRRHRGSVTATAKDAGITPKHVRALMRRHGIERRDFRPPLQPRKAARAKADETRDTA
jgi:DNA-binding NtrC family response regulator